MSLIAIGSIALDDVVTHHRTVTNVLGGSALYFSAAASIFTPVHVVAVVGDDFPLEELEFLRRRGVNIDGIEVIRGKKTFRWGGQYEIDMNIRRTTNLELNVFQDFNPVLNEECRSAEYVFLGNIDPDLQLHVLDQVKCPSFVAADTIECYLEDKPDTFKKLLKRIQLLFINDMEARLFTSKHNILTAARDLLDMGPDYVIIKKGEHGSILTGRHGAFIIPAYPVEHVVDPTGAGDCYAGGTMGFIAGAGDTGFDTIKRAVVYGGLVASFLVEDFSLGRMRELTRDDVEERMAGFRALTAF